MKFMYVVINVTIMLKLVDDEKYNVDGHVRDKVWSRWLIMLKATLE